MADTKQKPKNIMAIVLAVGAVGLFALALVFETRIAAGGGALLLLGAIIYSYVRTRQASDASYRAAERGAREVRKDIADEEIRSGHAKE